MIPQSLAREPAHCTVTVNRQQSFTGDQGAGYMDFFRQHNLSLTGNGTRFAYYLSIFSCMLQNNYIVYNSLHNVNIINFRENGEETYAED